MNTAESKIQQQIFVDIQNNYCLKHHSPRLIVFHVANEGQQHLVKIGVLSGVSDLIIIGKFPFTIYIEIKTETGAQSPEQKEFQKRVEGLGWQYFICRSFEDYLKLVKPLLPIKLSPCQKHAYETEE